MAEIFSFYEAPKEICLFFRESFLPFLGSEKLPKFLLSQAAEKFGASKDFPEFS
ncbi:hypothetical protein [Dapis sp. BLCC M172]|uniref:hypothetical protein n=1 Tax=Dapis sp. BLCC M172 TaxID=2975281 RepID=UPI003CEDFA56